jgi:hypothetical protein
MSYDAVDFTPLFRVNRSSGWSFVLLISRLLLAVFTIVTIPMIRFSDLLIFLPLLL